MANGWELLEGGKAWLSLERKGQVQKELQDHSGESDSRWTCASSSGLLPFAWCREAARQISGPVLGLAVAF